MCIDLPLATTAPRLAAPEPTDDTRMAMRTAQPQMMATVAIEWALTQLQTCEDVSRI